MPLFASNVCAYIEIVYSRVESSPMLLLMVIGLVFIAIQICCTDMPKQEKLGPLVISVGFGLSSM